jgi:hypothetical protein
MRFDNCTIALWGDTGVGKTYLTGELATHLREKNKQRSVVYLADRGWRTLTPQISAGIVLPVPLSGDPFNWLNHAIKGEVLNKSGKWEKAPDDIGLFAYESGTGIANELRRQIKASHGGGLVREGADGKVKSVGIGPAANTYKVGTDDATTGDTKLNRASIDKGHFGIMQDEMRDAIWQSQDLPGYVLWSFLALRKQDDDTRQDIIGPEVMGKALTAAVASWFHYSFHVDMQIPVTGGAEHVLHLSGHNDLSTGNARAGSNSRVGFGAAPDAPAIPASIKPASLVKALELLRGRETTTTEALKKKYGL